MIFPFFPDSGRTGSGNPDFLVPLDSLGQARSVGAKTMSVSAQWEPQ